MSCIVDILPRELHLSIFRELLKLHQNDESLEPSDTFRRVSHVCSLWRDLAVTTSALWTEIHVRDTSFHWCAASICLYKLAIYADPFLFAAALNESTCTVCLPWISTLLQRSATQPIDVVIDLPSVGSQNGDPPVFGAGHAIVLSKLFRPHASRIRAMTISSSQWQALEGISVGLIGVPMPQLEMWDVTRNSGLPLDDEWRLAIPHSASMPAIECPRDASESSAEYNARMYPNLQKVALRGVYQDWTRFRPCNLVSLDLETLPLERRPSFAQLREILLDSQTSLEHLTLSAVIIADSSLPPITLPKLRILAVAFVFPWTFVQFPKCLVLPNLQRLEISDKITSNLLNVSGAELMTLVIAAEEVYRQIVQVGLQGQWALKQVTSLVLRTPFFQHMTNYDDVRVAFLFNNPLPSQQLPVPMAFLFAFPALRNLVLVDPDVATLQALMWPIYLSSSNAITPAVGSVDTRAVVTCPTLRVLEISTKNIVRLLNFLQQSSDWCVNHSHQMKPRVIESLLLNVPPEWGTAVLPVLAKGIAGQVLNGSPKASFLVRRTSGAPRNVRDVQMESQEWVYDLLA